MMMVMSIDDENHGNVNTAERANLSVLTQMYHLSVTGEERDDSCTQRPEADISVLSVYVCINQYLEPERAFKF